MGISPCNGAAISFMHPAPEIVHLVQKMFLWLLKKENFRFHETRDESVDHAKKNEITIQEVFNAYYLQLYFFKHASFKLLFNIFELEICKWNVTEKNDFRNNALVVTLNHKHVNVGLKPYSIAYWKVPNATAKAFFTFCELQYLCNGNKSPVTTTASLLRCRKIFCETCRLPLTLKTCSVVPSTTTLTNRQILE